MRTEVRLAEKEGNSFFSDDVNASFLNDDDSRSVTLMNHFPLMNTIVVKISGQVGELEITACQGVDLTLKCDGYSFRSGCEEHGDERGDYELFNYYHLTFIHRSLSHMYTTVQSKH